MKEIILALISDFSWPLVVLIVLFALKKHFGAMLDRLSKLKAGTVEFQLFEQIESQGLSNEQKLQLSKLTSQLLSRYLKRKYPALELIIVHGETQGLWHYWVEANGKVIDITMSQKGIEDADVIWSENLWHQKCRRLELWSVEQEFSDVDEGADSASSEILEIGFQLVLSKMSI